MRYFQACICIKVFLPICAVLCYNKGISSFSERKKDVYAPKPMLSVQDLIVHSKEKGIQFNSISEAEAQDYLARNNNYFKLASYRKNYPKFTDGPKQGQYENLDFAYLIELARIALWLYVTLPSESIVS